ncbi:MAG TPA: hypothetical protein VGN07_07170 [Steroidobacteraceae bacterium]|jgi:hypothetical protein
MRYPAVKSRGGIVRFGRKPAKRDKRNLLFASILRAPLKLPKEYDFDLSHSGVPTPMFGNDRYGDCVTAGRAHQTLRFELIEQNKLIKITEEDVLDEYFTETGGGDTGLVVLDSLKLWRTKGWIAARRRYKIKAFAQLDFGRTREIKRAVYMDLGVGLGFTLPDAALTQYFAGKPWTVVTGKNGRRNPKNGHYVYVPGYTSKGPVCVTWGRKQQMSWGFLGKYCDEAYAIIDAVDTLKKKRAMDMKKLDAFLEGV